MSSALLAEVNAYLDAQGGGEGLFPTQMGTVHIIRAYEQRMPMRQLYKPSMCVVLKGAKEIMFGEDLLRYGAMQCLVVSMEMPASGRVVEASPDSPYLGITIDLDVGMLREVLEQLETPPVPSQEQAGCAFVGNVDEPLAECILRLIRMSQTPKAIPILFPSIMRELCYWLLTSPNGGELCQLALPESNFMRVGKAIYFLRANYAQSLRVDQMAEVAGMSASSFHQHFKALTSVTPLQFQKQLRLLEARRLMVADAAGVEDAAYQVGYQSPSQFSREYTRMFGVAPKRDALNHQRMYSQYASRKVRSA
ncbi:AraC family transcriptional regulator N-terminal domain-containing protein [Agrobacterium sp. a22-2]|uniref:AraC family transcriptional regulator n=1 Tax=Agrobacterium sp. a22-2 TaxID=2283840 RepID=UPI0034CD9725